jgi:tetratricopeptide (TPR) repeat protein
MKLDKEGEGVDNFERSREILESLLAEFPDVPWYRQDLAETKSHLGKCYYSKGGFNAASAEYAREAVLRQWIVRWQPEISEFREQLLNAVCLHGVALHGVPDLEGAIDEFEKAIKMAPESPEGYGRVAKLLATTPDAKYRDGDRAVQEAIRACELTECRDWRQLAVLAAANAEVGDFKRAQQYNDRSVNLAPEEQRANLRFRARLYAASRPLRRE